MYCWADKKLANHLVKYGTNHKSIDLILTSEQSDVKMMLIDVILQWDIVIPMLCMLGRNRWVN